MPIQGFGSPIYGPAQVITDPKKVLSQIIWSATLHHRVRRKLFWNQFTGKNLADEAAMDRPSPGAIIYEVAEFGATGGDLVTIPIQFPLPEDPKTVGVVGAEILTGTEEQIRHGHTKVTIEEWRRGVIVNNYANQQRRVNIDLVENSISELEKAALGFMDNSFTYTFIYGYSPNIHRSFDLTGGDLYNSPYAPYAHPNTYIYAGVGTEKPRLYSLSEAQSAGFVVVNASNPVYGKVIGKVGDNNIKFSSPDLELFDMIYALLEAKEIPPYEISNGMPCYVVVMHSYAVYALRQNPKWQNFMQYAMPRGEQNPLFTGQVGTWNNLVFLSSMKIPLGYTKYVNQTGVPYTTASVEHRVFDEGNVNYIKLNEYRLTQSEFLNGTSDGGIFVFNGVEAANGSSYGVDWVLSPIFVLGAGSLAVAYSKQGPKGFQSTWSVTPRETSDYGKFLAWGISTTFGIKRLDWITYNNDLFNQSSLLVWVALPIVSRFIPDEFNANF